MVAIIIIIVSITIAFAVFVRENKKSEEQPKQQSKQQQPIHFDLLGDNGEPLEQQPPVSVTPRQPIDNPKVKNLRYFCVKDKGYHVSVWPKDSDNWFPGIDYVEFSIAGMSHRGDLSKYFGEHAGKLEPEPSNPYDPYAIKILASDGYQVGYVPKDVTTSVRRFTTLPCKCYFYIGQNDDVYYSSCYLKAK